MGARVVPFSSFRGQSSGDGFVYELVEGFVLELVEDGLLAPLPGFVQDAGVAGAAG